MYADEPPLLAEAEEAFQKNAESFVSMLKQERQCWVKQGYGSKKVRKHKL